MRDGEAGRQWGTVYGVDHRGQTSRPDEQPETVLQTEQLLTIVADQRHRQKLDAGEGVQTTQNISASPLRFLFHLILDNLLHLHPIFPSFLPTRDHNGDVHRQHQLFFLLLRQNTTLDQLM